MTIDKHEITASAREPVGSKSPYRAPRLEQLGSLRNATRGTGPVNGDGGQGMMIDNAMMSDRRAKQDVVRVCDHPLGVGLYLFRYRPPYDRMFGEGRRIGVMADEVAERYPQAVIEDADGYLRVDYGQLFG